MFCSVATTEDTTRPNWDQLYQIAEDQAGYFTVAQAAEVGFSTPLILHHFRRGTLKRARRGIYRVTRFPASEQEDLVVLWLWSERQGVFSHETALVLHSLSDALPARPHLTVPSAWRARKIRVPETIAIYYADVLAEERTWYEHVPVTAPARTILDLAAAHADPDIVAQAIDEGARRGLFRRAKIRRALQKLGSA